MAGNLFKIMVTGIFFIAPKRGSQELDNLYAELTMPTGCIPLDQLNTCFAGIKVGPSRSGFVGGNEEKVSRKLSLVRNRFVKIENPWRNRELMFV